MVSRPKQKRRPDRRQQRARARRSARYRRDIQASDPYGPCLCEDCYPTWSPYSEPAVSGVEATRPAPGRATWIPPDTKVSVQGRVIEGGMIYLGSGVSSATGYRPEPCLIDPDLPVNWRKPDRIGLTLDAWPSYNNADPRARAAFLEWLAGGRSDELVDTGYVLMFFFGLERRLLVDIGPDLSHPEIPVIAAEILRLAAVYGHDDAISTPALSLLSFLDALALRHADVRSDQTVLDEPWEQSTFAVLMGLGKLVADDSKVPPEWALAYLYHHPKSNLRTPAHRCPSEFGELFMERYRTRYRGGMKIRRPARDLRIAYEPASHGFRGFTFPGFGGLEGDYRLAGDFEFGYDGHVEITLDGIPDVSRLTAPIKRLWKLAWECAEELDAYSRFIGKHPDRARSAAATCLLPDVLFEARGGPILDQLRNWTSETLAGRSTTVVALADLVAQWSPGRNGKLTTGEAKSLAALLGRLGVGIEPDVRLGATTPKPGSSAVLFPLPEGAGDTPSNAYHVAKRLLHLAAVVAGADGWISPRRLSFAVEQIGQIYDLDTAERRRAGAHMEFLATGRLGMHGVKEKVRMISEEARPAVGGLLVSLAMSDGAASPKQITALEKMFGHLGLDDAELYRQLHGLHLDDPVPVEMRGTRSAPRWAIPSAAQTARPISPAPLDAEKVQIRMAETARVSSFLADIFTEETPAEAAPAPTDPDFGSIVEGLYGAHGRLLFAMASEPEWERRAAEEMAVSLGLPLLDGALDVINEMSMDACGEPVVEGFDPVVLNPYAVKELC